MRRIKRFSTKRNELLFRAAAILLPLISIVLLLSQTAFAQNTYVITDGDRIVIHTTSTTNPADVLDEAGLSLGADDTYTTQGGDGVSEITVRRNLTVHIDNCGKELTVEASAGTVKALLERLAIVLDDNTTISAALDDTVYDGMEITISRTVHTTEVYTQAVPYETTYYEDETLPLGTQVVVSEGRNGEMICTADVTYRNGIQTNRNVIKQILSRQATPRIIAVGIADPLAGLDMAKFTSAAIDEEDDEEYTPEDTTSDEVYVPEEEPDTNDEPATEEQTPEVDENATYPIVGENTITTASGEVLTYTHTMRVEATAYTKTDEGCDDWTATGTLARYGAIAVDPTVIPYGTRMYIVSTDGQVVYGYATAEDCGGAINGARVDLYYDTTAECYQFGRRDCIIYFLA